MRAGILMLGLAVAGVVGCQAGREVAVDRGGERGRGQRVVEAQVAEPQLTFDTPEAAVGALKESVGKEDRAPLRRLFGPAIRELVSGDAVADKRNYEAFSKRIAEKTRVETKGERQALVFIGKEEFPFAIPLAKNAEGKWFFDTQAGKAEILARRVGKNELDAIVLMRAYVLAQREYASRDRDGDEVLEYASRLASRPGQKDGLYWEAGQGEEQSPFGPLAAQAGAEGYNPLSGSRRNAAPYHGYYYRILRSQGSNAPGGAYNYIINGNMIAGFALVAAPAEYKQSGVMTFIVNHQGKVYQKDLGQGTRAAFEAMRAYDPDSSWELVND